MARRAAPAAISRGSSAGSRPGSQDSQRTTTSRASHRKLTVRGLEKADWSDSAAEGAAAGDPLAMAPPPFDAERITAAQQQVRADLYLQGGYPLNVTSAAERRVLGLVPASPREPSFDSHQLGLPPHPAPSLQSSLEQYMNALMPLVSKRQRNLTRHLVDEFVAGEGADVWRTMQETSPKNWWQAWDLHGRTHRCRTTLALDSGPVVVLPPEPGGPQRNELGPRAARLTSAVLQFKHQYDHDARSLDAQGKTPLSMDAYGALFGVTRVPGRWQDHHTTFHRSTHICVVTQQQWWRIEAYHPNGRPLTTAELEDNFNLILQGPPPPAAPPRTAPTVATPLSPTSMPPIISSTSPTSPRRSSGGRGSRRASRTHQVTPKRRKSGAGIRRGSRSSSAEGASSRRSSSARRSHDAAESHLGDAMPAVAEVEPIPIESKHPATAPTPGSPHFLPHRDDDWETSRAALGDTASILAAELHLFLPSTGWLRDATPAIGALTWLPRKKWHAARQKLLEVPRNAASLNTIESSLFVVCLSGAAGPDASSSLRWALHGDSLDGSRWLDKSLTVTVAGNGAAAFTGEATQYDYVHLQRLAQAVGKAAIADTSVVVERAQRAARVAEKEKLERNRLQEMEDRKKALESMRMLEREREKEEKEQLKPLARGQRVVASKVLPPIRWMMELERIRKRKGKGKGPAAASPGPPSGRRGTHIDKGLAPMAAAREAAGASPVDEASSLGGGDPPKWTPRLLTIRPEAEEYEPTPQMLMWDEVRGVTRKAAHYVTAKVLPQLQVTTTEVSGLGSRECHHYGVDSMAVIQLAIQLAYYRWKGSLAVIGQYCSTARFRHGRYTTPILTVTGDSTKFCRAVCDRTHHPMPMQDLNTLLHAVAEEQVGLVKQGESGLYWWPHLMAMDQAVQYYAFQNKMSVDRQRAVEEDESEAKGRFDAREAYRERKLEMERRIEEQMERERLLEAEREAEKRVVKRTMTKKKSMVARKMSMKAGGDINTHRLLAIAAAEDARRNIPGPLFDDTTGLIPSASESCPRALPEGDLRRSTPTPSAALFRDESFQLLRYPILMCYPVHSGPDVQHIMVAPPATSKGINLVYDVHKAGTTFCLSSFEQPGLAQIGGIAEFTTYLRAAVQDVHNILRNCVRPLTTIPPAAASIAVRPECASPSLLPPREQPPHPPLSSPTGPSSRVHLPRPRIPQPPSTPGASTRPAPRPMPPDGVLPAMIPVPPQQSPSINGTPPSRIIPVVDTPDSHVGTPASALDVPLWSC